MRSKKPSITTIDGNITDSETLLSLYDRVQGLLGVLAVKLDPTRIPLGKGVYLIAPKGPRDGQGPVYTGHDHWDTIAGSKMEHFMHQGYALRRRSRKNP